MRTPENIAGQLSGNYANYIKQKRMEDVGHFLQNYVVDGGGVTQDPTYNNRIVAEEIVVSLNGDVMRRDGQWFTTRFPLATWYLDFGKDGDWNWSTSHPAGTAGTDYLTIATVTTNSLGNVSTITDTRGHVGGFLLKDEYGLENYATVAQLADMAINVRYPIGGMIPAVGDGTADDTAAIQVMLDYLHSLGGGTLFFPEGIYLCGDLKVYDDIHITGTVTATLLAKPGAFVVIDLNDSYRFTMSMIRINGNNRTSGGINSKGEASRYYRCRFTYCATAVGRYAGRYLGAPIVDQCAFSLNTIALGNIRDSKITNNVFTAQQANAIDLAAGGNDNLIIGNRIEWNLGAGIGGYTCDHNTISGNIFDRNSGPAISFVSCRYTTIIGNMFRRNGAEATTEPSKSHISLQGCTEIVIDGNVMVKGNTQDNGSGVVVPSYAYACQTSDKVRVTNNVLTGYTVAISYLFNNTSITQQSNVGDESKSVVGGVLLENGISKAKSYYEIKFYTVNASSSNSSFSFTGGLAVATYSRSIRKLKIAARVPSNGSSRYGEVPVLITREGGNAGIIMGTPTNHIGTNFLGTDLTLTDFTVSADGTTIGFTATNNTGDSYSLTIEYGG